MKAAARQNRRIFALIGAVLALSVGAARGQDQDRSLPAGLPDLPGIGETMMRSTRSPIALAGFDPVAYHLGEPMPGLPEHELTHAGAVWRFASAANRDAFLDAPALYEPRFAGFDASAVADGYAADADPRRFALIGNQLFFFRDEESRRRFLADAGLQEKARINWPAVARQIAR
ncbi:MAG TPA: YHS domain-containing (seleno)protein [Bosea sp. (in: a-proteobacteria)]|uniref:YHS domain-containing (seleno)protein n=1 Tax=Bosea sp. (in: a-proteobacteria) TaxID=1871050 RepID=UPI002E12D569|nr:YHS domain-containing (seleno)protein [Bosea sp. (in: a-proteobacteria)]